MVADIIKSLQDLSEDKKREFASKNYPSTLSVLGVTNPNLKIVLKELLVLTKGKDLSEKIALAKELIKTDVLECQQLAYEFLDKNKKALQALSKKDIYDLKGGIDNWVIVDYYAAIIVGYAWQQNILSLSDIKKFYDSDNFWERRIAIVATVSLNQKARGGVGDVKQTLAICRLAISDHADMINKALSWALRELAKRDKQSVIDFVNEYEHLLHARVLREVNNKLTFGTKNIK